MRQKSKFVAKMSSGSKILTFGATQPAAATQGFSFGGTTSAPTSFFETSTA